MEFNVHFSSTYHNHRRRAHLDMKLERLQQRPESECFEIWIASNMRRYLDRDIPFSGGSIGV